MADEINSIATGSGGETNTTDATATASDILAPKTAYVASGKVTGTIPIFDGSYECSGESTGGGESNEFISVTIDTAKGLTAYYINEQYSVVANQGQQASVVKAYRGIVWISLYTGGDWAATGNYLESVDNGFHIFKEDGGTFTNTRNPYAEQ